MKATVQSMTAFARRESQTKEGALTWEIRSVNHRYTEFNLRLPEQLRSFEPLIREHLGKRINRGKLEANLNYQPTFGSSEIKIDEGTVKQLVNAAQQITHFSTSVKALRMIDVLTWPGVVQSSDQNKESLQEHVLALLDGCLQDLVNHRQREGETLKLFLLQRLLAMQDQIQLIHRRLPEINQVLQKKLQTRMAQVKVECEPSRLEQEIALLLQKIDVSEELDRLLTHLNEVKRILEEGGMVGRRLDFLLQELNREANTLGAKSIDTDMTSCTVELKVLIEQMREQVQNIE